MHKLEITLSDDMAEKLEKLAAKLELSPEAFAASSVAEKLERHSDFQAAARYVLGKNVELYKRLA